MADRKKLLNDLDEGIKRKQQEIRERKQSKTEGSTDKPVARDQSKARAAEVNRENGSKGQGPTTPEGKARASANSLKHGYYANIEKLNPHDSASYLQLAGELRSALHPDGPAEEHLIKELAMLSARLKRLEAAEFALLLGNIEGTPPKEPAPFDLAYDDADLNPNQPDSRALASAYQNSLDTIERLHKIEVHLRRAYHRTWDRLERMQKERLKLPLDEMLKRTQAWQIAEAKRTNQPQNIPDLHPDLDEKGKLKKHPKGDPLHRPKKDDEEDETDD